MSIYNGIQRLRKLLGFHHDAVDRQVGGSGSITAIPGDGGENRAPASLSLVKKYEAYKKYDPIKFDSSDIPRGIGRVTQAFNVMCSRVGLQSTVRMDPFDYKTVYDFRNVGRMLVRIRWIEGKQNHEILLEPGELTTLKLAGGSLENVGLYPEIKAFHYGEDE